MFFGVLRRRTMIAAASAAMLVGALGSAQAASAAPYVAYAHFTNPGAYFYSGFGDILDIRVGNAPTVSVVCVSHACHTFDQGGAAEIHYPGSPWNLFFAHGQSRLVEIYACNASCMPTVWSAQLNVP